MKTVTVYYDHTGGWCPDGDPDRWPYSIEVPADATDCYVAGLLCILTGATQYAEYCEEHPDDDNPVKDKCYDY